MAASSITPAQAELISSLTPDEVPIKLRCAICSKLAANAFRLPCCEQAICETCQSTLPSSCPVCEHTPLSADDCKPHKNLRTTIRVFLKTEEKKRGASLPKESGESMPMTPAEPKQTPAVAPAHKPEATDAPQAARPDAGAPEDSVAPAPHETSGADGAPNTEARRAEEDAPADQDGREQREESEDPDEVQIILHRDDNDATNGATGEQGPEMTQDNNKDTDGHGAEGQQNSNFPGGFGFDSTNGQFPNFGTGDFNQMQMMAMQSGMPFPMMGMGMHPMMMQNMQNMYMNGGFGSQGMGMSGMNMGMGGFNGGVGAGSDNNWNGQQSWNVGQDNYNHPNASGMGNGDYGSLNSGFHAGFNQGNYGHQGQFNDYRGNRYGYQRGGRFGHGGRGGYGFRGGYGYGANGNFPGQGHMANQQPSGMADQTASGPIEAGTSQAGGVDEYGRTIRAGSAKDDESRPQPAGANEGGGAGADGEATAEGTGNDRGASDTGTPGPSVKDGTAVATQSIPTLDDSRSTQNGEAVSVGDPSMRRFGPAANGYRNHARGASAGPVVPPVAPAPDVPINAPKGPKAMLQGLPNTSLLKLRARGFHVPDDRRPSPRTDAPVLPSPATDHAGSRSSSPGASRRREPGHYRERSKERDRDADKSRDRSRERDRRDKDRDRSRTPASSRARSRSRDHRDERRRRRHRSRSASPDEREEDRHHRKPHRKHPSNADGGGGDDAKPRSRDGKRDDKDDERSRSASPGESRQSGHRSRRDREARKRRDRGGEDGRDARRKPSHRSHRDRDYDRDGKDRDRDRSTRDPEKDRERERERRRRGSKRASAEPPTPRELADGGGFNPPTAPRSSGISLSGAKGLEIRGASGRARDDGAPPASSSKARGSSSSSAAAAAAAADPHAAEREARNRERLLKETQRLAGLTGFKRRGGADGDGADDGRRSRRKGRRGEVVAADDDEARMRRLEAEREGPRWG